MSIAEPIATDLFPPPRRKMTIDEFLALPDDGVDRMLIDGELWEMGMTLRSHLHGEVAGNFAICVGNWSKARRYLGERCLLAMSDFGSHRTMTRWSVLMSLILRQS